MFLKNWISISHLSSIFFHYLAHTFFYESNIFGTVSRSFSETSGSPASSFQFKIFENEQFAKKEVQKSLPGKKNSINEFSAMIDRIQFQKWFCKLELSLELVDVEEKWPQSRPCCRRRILLNRWDEDCVCFCYFCWDCSLALVLGKYS